MVLEAEIELLELNRPIFSKGSQCMMHIHTYADDVTIKDIKWAIEKDVNTGEEKKKEMPKFTLRDEGKTIALGRVLRYIPNNKTAVKPVATDGAAAQATTSAADDAKAPVVFNLEDGTTEAGVKPLAGISE